MHISTFNQHVLPAIKHHLHSLSPVHRFLNWAHQKMFANPLETRFNEVFSNRKVDNYTDVLAAVKELTSDCILPKELTLSPYWTVDSERYMMSTLESKLKDGSLLAILESGDIDTVIQYLEGEGKELINCLFKVYTNEESEFNGKSPIKVLLETSANKDVFLFFLIWGRSNPSIMKGLDSILSLETDGSSLPKTIKESKWSSSISTQSVFEAIGRLSSLKYSSEERIHIARALTQAPDKKREVVSTSSWVPAMKKVKDISALAQAVSSLDKAAIKEVYQNNQALWMAMLTPLKDDTSSPLTDLISKLNFEELMSMCELGEEIQDLLACAVEQLIANKDLNLKFTSGKLLDFASNSEGKEIACKISNNFLNAVSLKLLSVTDIEPRPLRNIFYLFKSTEDSELLCEFLLSLSTSQFDKLMNHLPELEVKEIINCQYEAHANFATYLCANQNEEKLSQFKKSISHDELAELLGIDSTHKVNPEYFGTFFKACINEVDNETTHKDTRFEFLFQTAYEQGYLPQSLKSNHHETPLAVKLIDWGCADKLIDHMLKMSPDEILDLCRSEDSQKRMLMEHLLLHVGIDNLQRLFSAIDSVELVKILTEKGSSESTLIETLFKKGNVEIIDLVKGAFSASEWEKLFTIPLDSMQKPLLMCSLYNSSSDVVNFIINSMGVDSCFEYLNQKDSQGIPYSVEVCEYGKDVSLVKLLSQLNEEQQVNLLTSPYGEKELTGHALFENANQAISYKAITACTPGARERILCAKNGRGESALHIAARMDMKPFFDCSLLGVVSDHLKSEIMRDASFNRQILFAYVFKNASSETIEKMLSNLSPELIREISQKEEIADLTRQLILDAKVDEFILLIKGMEVDAFSKIFSESIFDQEVISWGFATQFFAKLENQGAIANYLCPIITHIPRDLRSDPQFVKRLTTIPCGKDMLLVHQLYKHGDYQSLELLSSSLTFDNILLLLWDKKSIEILARQENITTLLNKYSGGLGSTEYIRLLNFSNGGTTILTELCKKEDAAPLSQVLQPLSSLMILTSLESTPELFSDTSINHFQCICKVATPQAMLVLIRSMHGTGNFRENFTNLINRYDAKMNTALHFIVEYNTHPGTVEAVLGNEGLNIRNHWYQLLGNNLGQQAHQIAPQGNPLMLEPFLRYTSLRGEALPIVSKIIKLDRSGEATTKLLQDHRALVTFTSYNKKELLDLGKHRVIDALESAQINLHFSDVERTRLANLREINAMTQYAFEDAPISTSAGVQDVKEIQKTALRTTSTNAESICKKAIAYYQTEYEILVQQRGIAKVRRDNIVPKINISNIAAAIKKITARIESKEPSAGLPSIFEPGGREKINAQYAKLENIMKSISYTYKLIEEKVKDPDVPKKVKERLLGEVLSSVQEIEEISKMCGTRFMQSLPDIFKTYLKPVLMEFSVLSDFGKKDAKNENRHITAFNDQLIDRHFDRKEGIIKAAFNHVSGNNNVHTYSGFINVLIPLLNLPSDYDGADPLAGWNPGGQYNNPHAIVRYMETIGLNPHDTIVFEKNFLDEIPFNDENSPVSDILQELWDEYNPDTEIDYSLIYEDYDEDLFIPKLHKNKDGKDCPSIKPIWVERYLIKLGVLKPL